MSYERLDKTTFLVTCASGWEARAKEELHRALRTSRAKSLFLRGNLIVTCDEDPATALAAFGELQTECVGRVIPLQVQCEVGKSACHLETLAEASDLLPGPSPEASFKAVCERRGHHEWTSGQAAIAVGLRANARTGAPVDLDSPEQILSVQIFQDLAFLGVGYADQLLRKEITRMRRWASGERPLNRAEAKLREAISQFSLDLAPTGRALDIGAAPGGWTKVLSEHVAEVVAVDPAELDERVLQLPSVRHIRERSETLKQMPDIGLFDIITNDMNMDPDRSADVLCDLADLLRPGGFVVMTVKYVTPHRGEHIHDALEHLGRCFVDLRVGRVPHNAMETTIVGRRAGG